MYSYSAVSWSLVQNKHFSNSLLGIIILLLVIIIKIEIFLICEMYIHINLYINLIFQNLFKNTLIILIN